MIVVILKYLAFLGLYMSLCHSVESRQSILPSNFGDAVSAINSRIKYFNENRVGLYNNHSNFELWHYLMPFAKSLGKTGLLNLKLSLPNASEACLEIVLNFANAVNQKEPWVFEIIDAFGKPGSGILQGNFLYAGEYRECVNSSVLNRGWKGKYCSLVQPLPIGMFGYGMCVSDKCSNVDVTQIINFAIEVLPTLINITLPFKIVPEQVICHEPKSLDHKAVTAIAIISFIVGVVLVGTLYDVFKQYQQTAPVQDMLVNGSNGEIRDDKSANNNHEEITKLIKKVDHNEPLLLKILGTFSAYTNAKKIFHVADNGEQLSCLHAIRYLSFGWVVLGHTYAFGLSTVDNLSVAGVWLQRVTFQLITSGIFSVDSFFMLSGLLTSYLFLKEVNKPGVRLTPGLMIKYYLHRIWRLTPPYMLCLMISATLTPYLGDGPFYPAGGFEQNNCKDTWWTNLLYINNVVYSDKMCLGVSWYLANDMQFHWIAPLFLIPIVYGKVIIAIFVAIVLLFTHILSNALIMNAHPETQLGILSQTTGSTQYMTLIYYKPWTRIGPFVIGLLFGYLIFLHKQYPQKVKLNRLTNTIGWLVSLTLLGLVLFGLYPDFQGNILSLSTHIMYHSFSAIVWAVGLGFIIFACVSDYGGIINQILSLKFWTPLSRLTYSAYLIHSTILYYYYSTLEHPYHLQDELIVFLYVAHLVLSYAAAFFVSICFEIPMIGLEKFVFGTHKKQ